MTASTFGEAIALARANPGQPVTWHRSTITWADGLYTFSQPGVKGEPLSGTDPLPHVAMQRMDGAITRHLQEISKDKP